MRARQISSRLFLLVTLTLVAGCSGDGGAHDASAEDAAPQDDALGDAAEVAPPPPVTHRVLEHVVEAALDGIAVGALTEPSHVFGELPVDPRYTHALSFRMTPMLPPELAALPTSGPLVLYGDRDDEGRIPTLVLSPMDHFYAAWIARADDGATLRYGLHGDIEAVPAGYRQRFVLVEGLGLQATIEAWGDLLLADRGRARVDRYADAGLSRLGYWTDNGAAYYYRTEGDLNEADTLLAVKADAAARGIPLGYMQLDSWWYFKEPGFPPGGLVEWRPRPEMFPEGLDGFQDRLGLPIIAHSRWFAADNVYDDAYAFAVDHKTVPQDPTVYGELIAEAEPWGLVTYEQDWLMPMFLENAWLRAGVDHAEVLLAGMHAEATARGLSMQICMAGAAHLMHAVDLPGVTSVRTSIDYRQTISKESFWPSFHTANLLAWALGVWPFKDNFRSIEPHAEAEALISALSGGMVGPSDAVGDMDAALLTRTCRADGLLLKPDRPALPLDTMFLPHERPFTVATYSDREGLGRWTYLAAFHLASSHPNRTAEDALFMQLEYGPETEDGDLFVFPEAVKDWRVDLALDLGIKGPVVAYDWRAGTATLVEGTLELPVTEALYDHAYVVLAPVLDNSLALLGEVDKLVPLADRRFKAIELEANAIRVTLAGTPDEVVTLLAFDAEAVELLPGVEVTINANGAAEAMVGR